MHRIYKLSKSVDVKKKIAKCQSSLPVRIAQCSAWAGSTAYTYVEGWSSLLFPEQQLRDFENKGQIDLI
jgi:hypothetical protein